VGGSEWRSTKTCTTDGSYEQGLEMENVTDGRDLGIKKSQNQTKRDDVIEDVRDEVINLPSSV